MLFEHLFVVPVVQLTSLCLRCSGDTGVRGDFTEPGKGSGVLTTALNCWLSLNIPVRYYRQCTLSTDLHPHVAWEYLKVRYITACEVCACIVKSTVFTQLESCGSGTKIFSHTSVSVDTGLFRPPCLNGITGPYFASLSVGNEVEFIKHVTLLLLPSTLS